MKFFIPTVQDDRKAEDVYQAIVKFAKYTMGWEISNRRIRSIAFRDKGKLVRAIVGEADPAEGESVIAILDSNTYLVCTSNRGVVKGMPIMVGKYEVFDSEDFEL